MTNDLKDTEYAMRSLRKNFMVAAIQEGCAAIDRLRETDSELSDLIENTFSQQPRAAFWLVTEMDGQSKLTPLQQLNRGQRDEVINRLAHYASPKLKGM